MNIYNKVIFGFLMGFSLTILTVLLVFLNLDEVANLLIFSIIFGVFIYTAKKNHPLFGDKKEQLLILLVGVLWGLFWFFGVLSFKFQNIISFGLSILLLSAIVEIIIKKSKKITTIDDELIDELKITISEKSAFKAIFSFLISYIVFLYLSISTGLNLEISILNESYLLPLMILISQFVIFRVYYTLKFS